MLTDFHSRPLLQWSVSDVQAWLCSLGMQQHTAKFGELCVNGATLSELEKNDFVDLGVASVVERARIRGR